MKRLLVGLVMFLGLAAAQVPATALSFMSSVSLPYGTVTYPELCEETVRGLRSNLSEPTELLGFGCYMFESEMSYVVSIVKSQLVLAGFEMIGESVSDGLLFQAFQGDSAIVLTYNENVLVGFQQDGF